jgi:hypothetical protein
VIGALRAMATDVGKALAAEADRLDADAAEAKTLGADLTRLRAAWLRLGAALLGQA